MRFLVVFAALALAACQTPCPPNAATPTTATYHCEDGSDLHVTFNAHPHLATIVQEGYAPIDLPERIGGNGFRYADRGAELSGRSGTVDWTRPGAAGTECHSVTQ